MIEQGLLIAGATIFGMLGSTHLIYTFFTNKFDAIDPAAAKAIRDTSPVLTKETTMWDAWIGFNASHSLGAILVAAFYAPLSIWELSVSRCGFPFFQSQSGCRILPLAKRYWFKIPFIGILISTICFGGAAISINT